MQKRADSQHVYSCIFYKFEIPACLKTRFSFVKFQKPVTPSLPPTVRNLLQSSSETGFHYRTSRMSGTKLVFRNLEHSLTEELRSYYQENIEITAEERVDLCEKTVLQASNLLWKKERKKEFQHQEPIKYLGLSVLPIA